MFPNPLVTNRGYVGFDELLRFESTCAINALQQLAKGSAANHDSLKNIYGYMLLYATYSFSSLTLFEVSELWDMYNWAVDDAATRNLIIERIVARCRFERKVADNFGKAVQMSYAVGLARTLPSPLDFRAFAISIPRLHNRQLSLYANAFQIGCIPLEFSGVDALTIRSMPSFVKFEAPMGTVANILGHRNIWEEIVNRRTELALVLEDDALLLGIPPINHWKEELQALDVVFLNNRILPNYYTVPVLSAESDDTYLVPVSWGCGTEGYLITLRGAERLLNLFEHAYAPLDVQIMSHLAHVEPEDADCRNCRMQRASQIRLDCRRAYPFIVEHPPANFSTAMNRSVRGFCPGLWGSEYR